MARHSGGADGPGPGATGDAQDGTTGAPASAPATPADDVEAATPVVDGTRWLSLTEQRSWRAYLRGARLLEVSLDRDLQAFGVSLSEYEILSMLSEQPRSCLRMSELADLVVQSRSRLTHTATRLESRGWVARRPVPGDGRGVELVVTDQGHAMLAQLAPVHVESVRRHWLDYLDPDLVVALGDAMAAVRDHNGVSDAQRAAQRAEQERLGG